MDRIRLAYGRTMCTLSLPESGVVRLTDRQQSSPQVPEDTLVRQALEAPCGTGRLSELVRPGQSIAILVSDVTRPCPTARLLPPILLQLCQIPELRQQIAKMGQTGNSYSPSGGDPSHLDLRISNAYGRFMNPLTYLKNR